MAALSDFYPYIIPWLGNVSEPLLDQEIRRVARDLAVRTHCETVTQRINSVVSATDLVLIPGTMREPVRVMDAYYITRKLNLVASADVTNPLALVGGIGDSSAVSAPPSDAYTDNPLTKLIVYPLPKEAVVNAFTVRFTVRPTIASTTIPDILLQYENVVAAGVVANCQAMLGMPFSNTPASMMAKATYENLLAAMRAEIARGNARSQRRVQPQRFM